MIKKITPLTSLTAGTRQSLVCPTQHSGTFHYSLRPLWWTPAISLSRCLVIPKLSAKKDCRKVPQEQLTVRLGFECVRLQNSRRGKRGTCAVSNRERGKHDRGRCRRSLKRGKTPRRQCADVRHLRRKFIRRRLNHMRSVLPISEALTFMEKC